MSPNVIPKRNSGHYFEQGNQSLYTRKEKQIHFNWKISKLIHGHATLRFVKGRVEELHYTMCTRFKEIL